MVQVSRVLLIFVACASGVVARRLRKTNHDVGGTLVNIRQELSAASARSDGSADSLQTSLTDTIQGDSEGLVNPAVNEVARKGARLPISSVAEEDLCEREWS